METRRVVHRTSSRATPASCEYGIELTRQTSVYDVSNSQQAWRMVITVTDYNNVEPNIFLYQRVAAANDSEDDQDTFVAICSPVDLEDYPASAPVENADPAFFRMADVDLIVRSRTMLDALWESIVNDVDELVSTLAGICELGDPVVVQFGTLEASSSSSSSSSAPEEEESSSSAVCAADTNTSITITASDDPEFPISATFTEVGVQGGPPDCARVWELDGAVNPATLTMRVTTSIALHTFVLELIESGVTTEVDSGGLADGYKALFFYERGAGDYNLEVEGIT